MASRGEARERETIKCPSFDPSRRGATTALLRKHHFTRASARISRASASFTRSKIVFHRAATLGQRMNFTAQPCRASFRDAVSFRLRLPRRAQKFRPPRNDKFGRFFGKTGQFLERKGFNNGRISPRSHTRLKDEFHCAAIFACSKAEFYCAASASAVPAGASTSGLSSAASSVASSIEAEVSASGGTSRRRGRPSASKNSS